MPKNYASLPMHQKKYTKKIKKETTKNNKQMAGAIGLEPMTFGFGDRRSTN